jgi:H+-transporting ATPase
MTVEQTLTTLAVSADTGLTQAEVATRRTEHGYNEVAEKKAHPFAMFLGKFWGLSAWMLELIMLLSALLRNFSDLAVVGALLVVNAVLGFTQEHRAAGVVDTLRRRLTSQRTRSTRRNLAGAPRTRARPRRHRARAIRRRRTRRC